MQAAADVRFACQRPALFTEACRVPGNSVAASTEFKGVARWRILPAFIARRNYDVKAESGLTRRANAIPHAFN
jgi:hypothetical protein